MLTSRSTFLAIGGGEMADATSVLDHIFTYMKSRRNARMAVMTVATTDGRGASKKYNSIFRKRGVSHVEMVDVDTREDSFVKASEKKVRSAEAIFFTGGDQNMIPALLGGTALHKAIQTKLRKVCC